MRANNVLYSAEEVDGQQASDLEHGMRIGATRQNIRSGVPRWPYSPTNDL